MISVYVCVGYISFLLKAELSADTDSGGGGLERRSQGGEKGETGKKGREESRAR